MNIVRKRRAGLVGLGVSLAAVAALATTTAFTLGGFSAAISNSTSTFSSATIQLEESNGVTTCYSTGTGAGGSVTVANSNSTCTINALVGTLDQVPTGTALTTTLTFTNAGNHAATVASMVTSACGVTNASDDVGYAGSDTAGFCGRVDVTVSNTTAGATDKCVYPTQVAACPCCRTSTPCRAWRAPRSTPRRCRPWRPAHRPPMSSPTSSTRRRPTPTKVSRPPCLLPGPSASKARKKGTELAVVRHTNPSPGRLLRPQSGGGPLRRGRRCGLLSDAGQCHQFLGHLAAREDVGCEPQLLNGDRTGRVGVCGRIAPFGRLPGPPADGVAWGTNRKALLMSRPEASPGRRRRHDDRR